MTRFWMFLAALWFASTTFLHEAFSNEIYAPVREWVGHARMEYCTAVGISLAVLVLVLWVRSYVDWREPRALLRWCLLLGMMVVSVPLLLVTNIEIIHYFQYFLLVVLLRKAGFSEPLAYVAAFVGSVCDEGRQYILHPRFTGYYDWNDLFINNLGAALGIVACRRMAVLPTLHNAARLLRIFCICAPALVLLTGLALWATGLLHAYVPLPPGTEASAFPLVDGRQVFALSLRPAEQAFWQLAARGRTFHVMGVGEGLLFCPLAVWLLWRLVRNPAAIISKNKAAGTVMLLTLWLCAALPVPHAEAAHETADNLSRSREAQVAPSFQPVPLVLRARHTVVAPVIDGKLDESVWDQAVWSSSFKDMVDASPLWLRTEVALAWDAAYLYLAMRMEEPWLEAAVQERDGPVYRDPDMELFIAGADAYWELEVNARGTVYDVFWIWRDALGQGKPYHAASPGKWQEAGRRTMLLSGIGDHVHPRGERVGFIDADLEGLQSAVQLRGSLNKSDDTDQGWSVEIAIPWENLAPLLAHSDDRTLPPVPGDIWPMNISRFVTRSAEGKPLPSLRPAAWTLTKHGVFDSHMPEKFGKVVFE